MRVRVEGAVSDLHAADARYHVNCMTSFMSPKSVSAAINNSQEEEKADPAFDSVIDEMSKDRSRMWNSVELFHQYQQFGGKVLVQRSLVQKINGHFKEDVVVLSSPGLASLIVFIKNASTVVNLASDKEEDQQDILLEKLAKIICNEVKQIATDRSRYDIRITKESIRPTVMDLLSALSANLKYTLPALLIGNIITNVLYNNPTNLQIALGNLIRDSKSLINQMYQFRVTCSYDEILRFKKSAALAATKEIQLSGIHQGGVGLLQAVADNFDAGISSQNGKMTTHSLAMLSTAKQCIR